MKPSIYFISFIQPKHPALILHQENATSIYLFQAFCIQWAYENASKRGSILQGVSITFVGLQLKYKQTSDKKTCSKWEILKPHVSARRSMGVIIIVNFIINPQQSKLISGTLDLGYCGQDCYQENVILWTREGSLHFPHTQLSVSRWSNFNSQGLYRPRRAGVPDMLGSNESIQLSTLPPSLLGPGLGSSLKLCCL